MELIVIKKQIEWNLMTSKYNGPEEFKLFQIPDILIIITTKNFPVSLSQIFHNTNITIEA